ncbi:hypothetical protein BHE74_00031002 [Ensete ventricosum]|nr:hypothetical protein BHE74_00031002 [Ensete ventricosum]
MQELRDQIGGVSLQRSIFFVLISDVHVMLPLRFPNGGIRAKAARRRGGQPPCRAGHPRSGRLQGATGCGQASLQGGGQPRPKLLVGAAASMRGCPRAWLAPTAWPHGVATRCEAARGSPTTRAAACKGGHSCRGSARTRRHRPRGAARGQQRLSQGRRPTPTACSTVAYVRQWQRWRSEGKRRGLGHPFIKGRSCPYEFKK